MMMMMCDPPSMGAGDKNAMFVHFVDHPISFCLCSSKKLKLYARNSLCLQMSKSALVSQYKQVPSAGVGK